MGVRLYPINGDMGLAEKLVGVPAGTWDKLHNIEVAFHTAKKVLNEGFAECDEEEQNRRRRAWHQLDSDEYDAKHGPDSDDIAKLDHFITYGWGGFYDYKGQCDDPNVGRIEGITCLILLRDNGITLPDGVTWEDIQGVKWN